MFEVSGNDIANLGDSDLRSLVTRLALAELRKNGYPRSSVTAGGNQDAADGGLDVRVDCPFDFSNPDFVPRRLTGFQVKKPNMPHGAIQKEMRPQGVVRDVILELANSSGAYVIVSSQGSVSDSSLVARRKAMRAALSDVSNASQLHTDFYDRERLAFWVNEYPGIAAWVRSRVGRPLSGWSGIGDWDGGVAASKPYLSSDEACVIDEDSCEREHLTIAEGISRLRKALRVPGKCIRLVGMSGLGKTRLVQALFEESVGKDPLDSSLAIYTDYSGETDPTARDMARSLIANRHRAILIIDNCNPSSHTELARLCNGSNSEVSLITVEYDVRDDDPEHTKVFRLQPSAPELVSKWIHEGFPEISRPDCDRIAEFSDGNFRVARALAETLGKGESLGALKSQELFERIFHQRHNPDPLLLRAAQDLSLLYSIDGEDVADGSELALVGRIRGVSPRDLFDALTEIRARGVAQSRGRFRAILPQAIANPLAAKALTRIPPQSFDQFCATLTPRMLKSVSRRLGFLHDSADARATVARWLCTDGPLGDLLKKGDAGFDIITNIAPVAPEAVLERIEQELGTHEGSLVLAPGQRRRQQWIRLIKAIGYDASLFERSVLLVTRFLISTPDGKNHDSVGETFREFFHLQLSGTQATPEQRRSFIRDLAASEDPNFRRCGQVALCALLKTGYFSSMRGDDFGARSRDLGWSPKTNGEIWSWYEEAINLVVELVPEREARALLASHFRGLWCYPGAREALSRAATIFIQSGTWIEGWIAARSALRYGGKRMPAEVRDELKQLILKLKPLDLLNQARAVVLNNRSVDGWDFADGEDDDNDGISSWEKAARMAHEVGRALAGDDAARTKFIAELLGGPRAERAWNCGLGLAEGADDLGAMWLELTSAYRAVEPHGHNEAVLGGFICGAYRRDQPFTSRVLEEGIANPDILPILPYLQGCAGIDSEGIARLRRALDRGGLIASSFNSISNSVGSNFPPAPLAALLTEIAALPDGVEVALNILHGCFYSGNQTVETEGNEPLISVGRDLLIRADFSRESSLHDYGSQTVIRVCLSGAAATRAAQLVCTKVRSALDLCNVTSYHWPHLLAALFETQPYAALDAFLLPDLSRGWDLDFDGESPIESLDIAILQEWAAQDPATRYRLIGKSVRMFKGVNGDSGEIICPLFASILELAPNKRLFLSSVRNKFLPSGWSGSLADVLIGRKVCLIKLSESADSQVRAWVTEFVPELDRWIEHHKRYDRAQEESFE